jgi:hypothetical protein
VEEGQSDMPASAWNQSEVVGDTVGLAALGLSVFLLAQWLLPDDGFRWINVGLAFIVLGAFALYLWHSDKYARKLSDAAEWMAFAGITILLGGLSFGADVIAGLISHPQLSPLDAGTKAGGPFGFLLTLFLCPGLTIVAVSGFIRALLIDWNEPTSSL